MARRNARYAPSPLDAAPIPRVRAQSEDEGVTLLPPAKMFAALVKETRENKLPLYTRIAYENALVKLSEYAPADDETMFVTLHRKIDDARESIAFVPADEAFSDLSEFRTDELLISYAESGDSQYDAACLRELRTRFPYSTMEMGDAEFADLILDASDNLIAETAQDDTAKKAKKAKARTKAPKNPANPDEASAQPAPATPSEVDEGHKGDEGLRGDAPAGIIASEVAHAQGVAKGNEGDEGLRGDDAEDEEPGHYESLRDFTFRHLDRRQIKVLLDGKFARKDFALPFDYDTDKQHAGAQVLTRATIRDELEDAALVVGLKTAKLDLAIRLWTNKSRLERSVELWSTLTTRTPDPKPFFERVMRMAEVRFPNEDPKYVAAVFEEIVWQTKRKMRLLEVKYPFFFILWSEEQGGGKSHLSKMLASPLQEAARKRVTVKQIVSGEKAAKMWEANILIVDDMDKADQSVMGSLKSIVTGDEFSFRPMNTNDFESLPNVTTLLGSCDQPVMDVISDSRGMRRFVDLRHTDLTARHNPRGRELTDAVFDPSIAHLYWQVIDHRRDSPIDEHEFTKHLEERQELITPAKQMSSFDMWLAKLDFPALPKTRDGFAFTQTLHEDYQITLDGLRRRDVMGLVPFGRQMGSISLEGDDVQEPHHRFYRKQVSGRMAYQPVEPLKPLAD